MNPAPYRIVRRRKRRPGDAASTPTGPLRWHLQTRVPATGIASLVSRWEWQTISYHVTHADAVARLARIDERKAPTLHGLAPVPWEERDNAAGPLIAVSPDGNTTAHRTTWGDWYTNDGRHPNGPALAADGWHLYKIARR